MKAWTPVTDALYPLACGRILPQQGGDAVFGSGRMAMGMLVEGVWRDQWYDTKSTGGRFVRSDSRFRNWITADGSAVGAATGACDVSTQGATAHRGMRIAKAQDGSRRLLARLGRGCGGKGTNTSLPRRRHRRAGPQCRGTAACDSPSQAEQSQHSTNRARLVGEHQCVPALR